MVLQIGELMLVLCLQACQITYQMTSKSASRTLARENRRFIFYR